MKTMLKGIGFSILLALAWIGYASAQTKQQIYNAEEAGITEGWDVVVTYHWAEVQVGGGILWKQAQHHEAALSTNYTFVRSKAATYAQNGLWISPSGGGVPGSPEHFLPPGAIHDVALVYVFIN